jgi:hypothetical protein
MMQLIGRNLGGHDFLREGLDLWFTRAMVLLSLVLGFCATTLRAQEAAATRPVTVFPRELRKYLGLSDDQITRIVKLNKEHDETVLRKRAEINDLQMRGSQSGQGNPYRQMEVLGAEIAESLRATQSKIRALLDRDQRSKLWDLTEKCVAGSEELLSEAKQFRVVDGSGEPSDAQSPFGGTTPIFSSDTGKRRAESKESPTQENPERKPKKKPCEKPQPIPPPQ